MSVNFCETNNPLIPHQMQLLMQEHNKAIETEAEALQNVPKLWENAHFPIPKKIEMKLFAGICAEPFIIGTQWEGDKPENPICFLADFLMNHPKNGKGTYSKQVTLLKELEAVAKRLSKLVQNDDKQGRTALADELQKTLQDKGEVWFPGGWKTASGGHALVIHASNEGTVTIINSGAGTQYHQATNDTHLDPLTGRCVETYKVQQFLRINHCRHDRIQHRDFFLALIELRTSAYLNEKAATPGAKHIYEGVITYLQGEIEPPRDPGKHPELYLVPQVAGTCTVSSITTTLYYHFLGLFDDTQRMDHNALKEFKQLHIEWQFAALIAQMNQDKAVHSMNVKQVLLYQDVNEHLARQVATLNKEGILDKNQVDFMHATLRKLEQRVASPFHTTQNKALHPIKLKVTNGNAVLDTHLDNDEPPTLTKTVRPIFPTFTSEIKDPSVSLDPQLLHDPSQALTHYQLLLQPLHDADDEDPTFFRKLIEVLCHLPIPTRDTQKFWNKVPEDQILPWMEEIVKSYALIEIAQKDRNRYCCTAEELVMMHTFLAILDKLARRLEKNRLKGFSPCYIELLSKVNDPSFQLKHPKMQHLLHEILLYFDPDFRLENTYPRRKSKKERENHLLNSLFSFFDNSLTVGKIALSDESFSNNPTVRFFKQFTDLQELNETYKRKIGEMIADKNTGKYPEIPKEVWLLKQGTIMCFKCSRCPEHPYEIKLDEPDPIYRPNISVIIANIGGSNYGTGELTQLPIPHSMLENQNKLMGVLMDSERHKQFVGLYIKPSKRIKLLSRDLYMQMQMVHQDPYDEVNRALSLFRAEFRILKNELRYWFPTHFYRPGRLASQLKDTPQFAQVIEKHLTEMRDRLIEMDDYSNLASLIQLHQELSLFVFLDPWFHLIWPIIEKLNKTDRKMAIMLLRAFYDGFIHTQPQDFKTQRDHYLRTFLKSASSFFLNDSKGPGTYKYYERFGLFTHMWPMIQNKLDEDKTQRSEVLQVYLTLTYPEAPKQKWEGSFPRYTSEDYTIDFDELSVSKIGQGKSSNIDYHLTSALNRNFLNPHPISTVEEQADGSIVINRGKPNALIARMHAPEKEVYEPSYSYYRHFSGKEHRLVTVPEELAVNLEMNAPYTHAWLDRSNDAESLIITHDDEILFRVINGIVQRVSDGAKLTLGEDQWEKSKTNPFEHIEKDRRHVLLWKKEGELVEVAFPKLKLNLVINGDQHLVLKDSPHLRVITPIELPELQVCNASLWLQNSHGDTTVWVMGFESDNRSLNHRGVSRWAEFSFENGQLKTDELWGRILLCGLYAKIGNYKKAHQALLKAQYLKRFNENEVWALNDIEGMLDCHDHPSAIALRLKLVLYIKRNDLLYPQAIGEEKGLRYDVQEIHDLLEKYYKLHSHAPSFQLTHVEEKMLLEIFERLVFEGEGSSNESTLHPAVRAEKYFKRLLFKYIVFPRMHFLDTGKARLGYRTFPKATKIGAKGGKQPIIYVKVNNKGVLIEKPNQDGEVLFNENALFIEFFNHYYSIAKNGTQEERETLLRLLHLNCRGSKTKDTDYQQILIEVAQNPKAYPHLEEIIAKIATNATPLQEGQTAQWEVTFPNQSSLLMEGVQMIANSIAMGYQWGRAFLMTFQTNYQKPLSKRKVEPLFNGMSSDLKDVDDKFDKFFRGLCEKYFTSKLRELKDTPKFVIGHLKSEQADLEVYQEEIQKENVYSLRPEKTLKELKTDLEDKIKPLKTAIKTERVALLWQSNLTHSAQEWLMQKGLQRRMTFSDLQKWVLSREMKENLQKEEVKRLLFGVATYLIKTTRLAQMEAIVSQIDQVKKENRSLVFDNCGQMLMQTRAYVAGEKTLPKLWFEYANHYLYRKIQIEKWKTITPENIAGVLAEMPTGSGKTKTLAASIDQKMLSEETPVLNIWPASLEHVNAADIQTQMDESYGQQTRRLYFDRATDFTTESLELLWKEVQKPQPISLRSETLRALQLHFQMSLMQAQDELSNDLSQQIELLWKILRYFKLRSFATIDEGHQTLHPMDRLIYTQGSPTQVPKKEVEVFENLFLKIVEQFSNFEIKENRQAYFSDDQYDAMVKELAKSFAKEWKLENGQVDTYRHYCMGECTMPDWIDNHPRKESLCLLKGVLSYILAESRKGHVDEHYGLSKQHKNLTEFAIPYKSANTPKETAKCPSQFQNPHETIVKTYLLYLYKGLASEQFKKLINHLEQVIDLYRGDDIKECEAYQLLHTLLPGSKKEREKQLKQKLDTLATTYRYHQKAIFYYIHHLVIPQIKIYPQMLVSTVQNLRDQVKTSLTFTATPQHQKAHGPNTHFVPMQGTKGKVSHLLLTQCKDKERLHSVPVGSPEKILDHAITLVKEKKFQSVIDAGALFKGISCLEVAQKMRQAFSGEVENVIKGIVYFDEDREQFCILSLNDGQIYDYRNHHFELHQLFVYLDQSRSVGSDIPLPINAIALMLVNRTTTMNSARQGAGRPRQLDRGQKIELMYTEDICNNQDDVTIMDLLAHFNTNSLADNAETNYQAQPLQMDNEIHSVAMGKLLNLDAGIDATPHIGSMVRTFGQFKDLFIFESKKLPSELYGTLPKEVNAKKALQDHLRIAKNRVKGLTVLTEKEQMVLRSKLDTYQNQWTDLPLPDKVKVGTSLGLECEVLQEVEVETQVQVNAQVQNDLNKGFRAIRLWSDSLDLFQPGWERPHSMRSITTKILEIIQKLGRLFYFVSPDMAFLFKLTVIVTCSYSAIFGILGGGLLAAVAASITTMALIIFFSSSQLRIDANAIPRVHGCAVWKLSDVMQHHFPKTNMGAFFSPNLLVSNNFSVQETYRNHEIRQTPFTDQQKALVQVLVIQDENKKVQMMLIDQNDSIYFRRRLQEDRENTTDATAATRTRKIAIYDLKTKDLEPSLISQGKNPFDKDELENNPQFQALLAEAKFFAAEIKYTTVQTEHLRTRAQAAGLNNTLTFFQDTILPQKPIHYSSFDKDKNFLTQTDFP